MLRYALHIAAAVTVSWTADAPQSSSRSLITTPDTLGCRRAAVGAGTSWLNAIGTGDTAAVRRSVAPHFVWISAGRNDWPEPTFRATSFADLFAYVQQRSAQHEHIADISIPTGGWHQGRLLLGVVSYTRSADDVAGIQHWLGKGEYECGKGIYSLSTAPQGRPGRRQQPPRLSPSTNAYASMADKSELFAEYLPRVNAELVRIGFTKEDFRYLASGGETTRESFEAHLAELHQIPSLPARPEEH